MINVKKLSPDKLELLIDYFQLNQNNVKTIINDFGEIESENEYGTLFLMSSNSLFKVFWISQKDGRINSIGFGGPDLGLNLSELFLQYPHHTEGFLIYDDVYVYVFFKSKNYKYTIKITSREKVIEQNVIINDIPINKMEITFY